MKEPKSTTTRRCIQTGVEVKREKQVIRWTIKNFAFIRNYESMLNAQCYQFTAGATLGHPTQWSLYLREISAKDGKKRIGIYCMENPKKDPSTTPSPKSNVSVRIEMFVRGSMWNGCFTWGVDTGLKDISKLPKHGWILMDSDSERLLYGKDLTIRLTFKSYVGINETIPVTVDLHGNKTT